MVLPFPYRLITAWINNPSPNPLDGPTLEVVEAPWTCQSRPDMGPNLSKLWIGLGGCLPIDMATDAWQKSGFSPRLLHCGSNDHLVKCVVEWFDARAAHEQLLEYYESVLRYIEDNLMNLRGINYAAAEEYIAYHLSCLQDLNKEYGGIRDQEIRGTYLVLSSAARGFELLSSPEERMSILKQLMHLFEDLLVAETKEETTGVRIVDRVNALVCEYERVLDWARECVIAGINVLPLDDERFLGWVRASGRQGNTPTTSTTTTTTTTTTTSQNNHSSNSNNNNNNS